MATVVCCSIFTKLHLSPTNFPQNILVDHRASLTTSCCSTFTKLHLSQTNFP